MIYYFSGTGNSLYLAQELAARTNDSIASIAELMAGKPMPETGEIVGIVYPVYAWAPPKMVRDFVRRHSIHASYVFSVCTCGEDSGSSMSLLEKAMGRGLDAAYSVVMPNNYMIGFDVDSPMQAEQKLRDANVKIVSIADAINNRRHGLNGITGGMGRFLSRIIPPLFDAFACSAKAFYAQESCNGCGKCALVCPTRNITIDSKPQWGKRCTTCFACINHCPTRAIQRGKGTKAKGRYVNPNCRVEYHWE